MPDIPSHKTDSSRNQWLIDATRAMVHQARAETDGWITLWQDALNYVFNNQLAGKKRKEGWPAVQANYIFPAVIQEIALHAQRRPRILARPYEQSDLEAAEVWNGLLQFQYDEVLDMAMLNIAASLDAKVYGIYVAKTLWEPKAFWDTEQRRWIGEPRANLIRPEFFGADPEAEKLRDAQYVYSQRRVSTQWAMNRWPDFADQIQQAAHEQREDMYQQFTIPGYDRDRDKDEGIPSTTEGRLVNLLTRFRDTQQAPIPTKSKPDGIPPKVTLTEVYFRDLEERDGKDPQAIPAKELESQGAIYLENEVWKVGNPEFFGGRYKEGEVFSDADWPTEDMGVGPEPVFPYGRYVLKVGEGEGETILNPEEKAQVWPYRRWPYVVGVNHILPHTWRGLNATEMPKGLQDWMNISFSHLLNYVKFFGDPLVLKEEGAVKAGTKLKVKAGAIWNLLRGGMNKIKRDPPPTMGNGVPQAIQFIARQLQDDTGIHEPSRGQTTAGKQTATEIATLQTAVQTRVGLQLIYKDLWAKEVMQRVADLDKAHMTPGEIVRIVGEDKARAVTQMTQQALDLKFDVVLKVGTALPFDQERRKQDAERLFTHLGMAYLPELLDAFEIENKEEILARAEAWQQLQQLMAQQQQGAPAGGPGAPPPVAPPA